MGQRCEATVGENEALPSIWIESGPFSFHTELEIKLDPIWRHIYNKNCCNISLFYLHFTIWALSAAHQLANEFFQKVSSWLRVPHSLGALMVHLTARIGRNDSDLFDIYMSICQKKKKRVPFTASSQKANLKSNVSFSCCFQAEDRKDHTSTDQIFNFGICKSYMSMCWHFFFH